MPKPGALGLVWAVGLTGVCLLLLSAQCSARPQKRLSEFIKHYEPLTYDKQALHRDHTDFSHRWSKGKTIPYDFTFTLEAHGRVFHLELHPDDEVFAADVNFLDGSGKDFEMDRSTLLVGRVARDPGSFVHGSIFEGRFRGIIDAFGEKFTVEPSLIHFDDEQEFHSVIYKNSDIEHHKVLNNNSCGVNHTKHRSIPMQYDPMYQNVYDHLEGVAKSRKRRNSNLDYTKIECRINIAGDQIYSAEIARVEALPITDSVRVKSAVVQALALFVREANKIFTQTTFDTTRDNARPEGVKMVIQTARAYLTAAEIKAFKGGDQSSTLDDPLLSANTVLDQWSSTNIWDDYCLSYLISYRDFDQSILGLAWVSAICDRYNPGTRFTGNTGLVTTRNAGQTLPQLTATLVFAHEIGHNMGAEHDKDATCVPSDSEGGRYIMFATANSGKLPHHKQFSPCSINYFSKVLIPKAFGASSTCFKQNSNGQICGNGVKEGAEECDCGVRSECSALPTDQQCCTIKGTGASMADCTYSAGSTCSSQDGPCCASCGFVPAIMNRTCSEPHECRVGTERCNGLSASCPRAASRPDGIVCNRGRGTCMGGECNASLCALQGVGLEECDCAEPNECAVCCKKDGKCTPLSELDLNFNKTGISFNRVAGAPCRNYQGHCNFLHFCRGLDDTGLLFQITNTLFSLTTLGSAWDWAKTSWYYILLGIAGLVAVFALIIHFCAKKTPRTVAVKRGAKGGGRHVEMKNKH